VRPPVEYGVAPYWDGQAKRALLTEGYYPRVVFGEDFPSLDAIMASAYCVPTSFALSARRGGAGDFDGSAWAQAYPDSLFGRAYAAAFGSPAV